MNIWNPALLARAFLFFAYPAQMSGDKVWVPLKDTDKVVDGFTGATPMADAAAGNIDFNVFDAFIGLIPGSIGETSTLAILLGADISHNHRNRKLEDNGFYHCRGRGYGHNTQSFLRDIRDLSPAVASYFSMPFWHHLIIGGFAFGAVFMATDPVSAAQTDTGKWIYGFLIGVTAILFRVVNPAYPEGMMLAILLMNTFAPLIDHYVVEANIKRRLKRVKVAA
jgi:Na+-transporting NADH:ubiquinone oxidoreductase subunit B